MYLFDWVARSQKSVSGAYECICHHDLKNIRSDYRTVCILAWPDLAYKYNECIAVVSQPSLRV